MKLYKIGEFSKIVNVPPSTLRNWHDKGHLIPYYISPSKTRYYSSDQVQQLITSENYTHDLVKYDMVGYCHIYDDDSKSQTQLNDVTRYISQHASTSVVFVEDVGKTHYERLKQIIHMIMSDQISCLVVYDKRVFDEDTYNILDLILKDRNVQLVCTHG